MKYKIIILCLLLSSSSLLADRFSPFCLDSSNSCRRPQAPGIYNKQSNKTFICWAYAHMDLGVIEYDHTTGRWSEKKILKGTGKNDFHAYPVMIQDQAGYLHIFASIMSLKCLVYYKSTQPNSISDWQQKSIPALTDNNISISYIMPVLYPKTGELFLFGRALYPGEDFYKSTRRYIMIKMNPETSQWSQPQIIVSFNNSNSNNSPYFAKIIFAPENDNYPDRFLLSWTTCNGHPQNEPVKFNNVYFAYMALDKTHENNYRLFNAESKDLGHCIDENLRHDVMVFNTGNLPYRAIHYNILPSYDDCGNPEIMFRYKKKTSPSEQEVNLWLATRHSNTWQVKKINNKQYLLLFDFLKKKDERIISVLDFSKKNLFMVSKDKLQTWAVKNEFSFYKCMSQVTGINNCNNDLRYFSKLSNKHYSLTHKHPCYVYGNLKPQLLCYYSFDVNNNNAVKDNGLYQVDGKLDSSQRGDSPNGKALLSTTNNPNLAVFPHNTRLVNDFTVSFWIKPTFIKNQASLINTDNTDKTGWKLALSAENDTIEFTIHGMNEAIAKVNVNNFLKDHSNSWTKITAQYKSGHYIKVFINDKCAAEQTTTIPSVTYSDESKLSIGSKNFLGLIDEVRLCDGIISNPDQLKPYK